MKLLLKGGTVVSAAGSKIADLLIEDEKIVRVGQDLTDAEATVVPMEGKLLFPALSTRTRISTSTFALDAMFDAGITSFKMYLTYPAMMIGDGAVYRALKALKVRGGIAGVHCENAGVIDARIAELKASGLGADVVSHPISRPDYLEAEAVSRLLRIAQAADAPVIIVHTTNRASLDEIAAARRRGQTVYVETCPQYLALDDGVYYDPDYSSAARYVCAPPIRSQEDSEALWKALRRGEVQTISTDHCSFTLEQKDMGREDFTKIPGGLPGVETRGEVVYTVAINENKLSLGGVCRALSENPAKLYGLYPRKGVIAAGSDADIGDARLRRSSGLSGTADSGSARRRDGRKRLAWRLVPERGELRLL